MIIVLAALLPIVLLVLSALISKRGFLFSAAISLALLIVTSATIWKMPYLVLMAASLKGVFLAVEIILIIFGALLLFGIFRREGGEKSAKTLFDGISPDYRVKAIIIAWAFICFIEGISGFGTPAMIVAPILITIGFTPAAAVMLSLMGDSVPVIFGAVGLPITYGMASVVGSEAANGAASLISLLNIPASFFVVIGILAVAVRDKGGSLKNIFEKIPFALFASLAVSIPSFITFRYFGPELPSIMGGLIGVILISIAVILKNKKRVISGGFEFKPFIPYASAVVLLAVSRIPQVRMFLTEVVRLNMESIFGVGINYSFSPLYSPAFVFFAVAAMFFLYFIIRGKKEFGIHILRDSFGKIIRPMFTLVLILSFVQIMINSGINDAGLPGMAEVIARAAGQAGGKAVVFFSPFVGALGAFIAGSSTVSNLLFSSIQYSTAAISGVAGKMALTMQGMGSAAGNMISIHNILAALAVVGAAARTERTVLRSNLPFLVLYLIFLGIIGLILSVTLY